MTSEEMKALIKKNLDLQDDNRDLLISDVILDIRTYCYLPEYLPEDLEPFARKKVKGIIDYEAANGSGYLPEVASIKEGDGSITWAQTEGNTKASIYGLSESDKTFLRRFRRLRGYA
jgi:hypothetical protein